MRTVPSVLFLVLLMLFASPDVAFSGDLNSPLTTTQILIEENTRITTQDNGPGGVTIDVSFPPVTDLIPFETFAQNITTQNPHADTQGASSPFPFIAKWVFIPEGMKIVPHILDESGRRVTVDEAVLASCNSERFSSASSEAVSIGKPAHLRGIRMVPVAINPLQILDAQTVFERQSLTVELEFQPDPTAPAVFSPRRPCSKQFSRIIDNVVLNPPLRDNAPSSLARILIVHSELMQEEEDDIIADIERFAEWKRRMGYDVVIQPIDTELDQTEIKDIIRSYYEAEQSIEFLIIMGAFDQGDFEDYEHYAESPYFFSTWTERMDGGSMLYSDNLLVEFDEDELGLPDVIVGRFMCPTYEDLSFALHRSMKYEQDPFIGDWLSNSLITIRDDIRGFNYSEIINIGRACFRGLRDVGYEVVDTVWYDDFDQQIFEQIREAIEETGYSLALSAPSLFGAMAGEYIGEEYIVNPAQVGEKHLFMIADAYCCENRVVVPFFNSGTDEEPNGPVAGYGCWEEVSDHVFISVWSVQNMRDMNEFTGGYLFFHTFMQYSAYLELTGNDPWSIRYRNSFRYIGDPTLQIRTAIPDEITVVHPDVFSTGATGMNLRVIGENGNSVSDATVCIRQPGRFQYVSRTNAAGEFFFTIPEGLESGEVQITACKHNTIPFIVDVEVSDRQRNVVLESAEIDDEDGLFGAGETVGLAMSLRNTGEERIETLVVDFTTDSEFLTIDPARARLADVSPDNVTNLTEEVNMTLSQECPAGTVLQVRADVQSQNNHWQVAFDFTSSGAAFACNDINARNLAIGRNGTLAPRISNVGDLASTTLRTTLVSLTPYVTVLDIVRTYPALNPDATANPNQAFTVIVDRLFFPGRKARFELNILTEQDVARSLILETEVIGEASPGDPFGPDTYGYICFDSGDENWRDHPNYNWIEINPDVENARFEGRRVDFGLNPEDINYSEWNYLADLELPFDFQFYGEVFDSITVCTNGWVMMGTSAVATPTPYVWDVPVIKNPENLISPYCHDLNIVYVQYTGLYRYYAEELGVLVIEWSGVEVRNNFVRQPQEFQIQLFDPAVYETRTGDGDIVFQYKQYDPIRGNARIYERYPATGIRGIGQDGLLHSWRNNEYEGAPVQARPIESGSALRFTTDVEYLAGSASGRIVRSEDLHIGIPGATVDPLRDDVVQTDGEGFFRFDDLRPGSYELHIEAPGFNIGITQFEVVTGQETVIFPVPLTHPEPFISDQNLSLNFSLRPDGSRTRVNGELQNIGSGDLEYKVEVRDREGNAADYAVLDSIGLNEVFQDEERNWDSFRAYSVAIVDSLVYMPVYAAASGEYYIAVMSRDGERRELMDLPVELVRMRGLTWDGEAFWGVIFYSDDAVVLLRFGVRGNILDAIDVDIPPSESFHVQFSGLRNSLFIASDGYGIVEVDLDGNIIERFPVHLPGRELEFAGLAWNPYDVDGMNLYFIDADEMRENHLIHLLKMDVETGRWMEAATFLTAREVPENVRGMCFVFDKYSESGMLAIIETQYGRRAADDLLVMRSIGPNLSLMTPGSLRNMTGSVPPQGSARFGFEINADGWEDGEYGWSYYITHNALADPLLVPVTLTIDEAAEIDEQNAIPTEFALSAIYPNPFNSMTRISFSVGAQDMASLQAYDLNGRLVQTLYEDYAETGSHTLAWDASILPSGVYLIKLQSGGQVRVKKVVLMR